VLVVESGKSRIQVAKRESRKSNRWRRLLGVVLTGGNFTFRSGSIEALGRHALAQMEVGGGAVTKVAANAADPMIIGWLDKTNSSSFLDKLALTAQDRKLDAGILLL